VRITLSGPHLGPLHSTLWAWSSRRRARTAPRPRHRAASRRRAWPQALCVLLVIGAVSKAYEAALWAGILVTVTVAAVVLLAAYGLAVSVQGEAAPARDDAWKAQHVPASAEYKAAHSEGPRDWEQVS
jgi:small-conductance mechanosensitive channel